MPDSLALQELRRLCEPSAEAIPDGVRLTALARAVPMLLDAVEAARRAHLLRAAPAVPDGHLSEAQQGWKEATIAWSVCASLHRQYGKGKDPLFTTRQADFVKHENDARSKYVTLAYGPAIATKEPADD